MKLKRMTKQLLWITPLVAMAVLAGCSKPANDGEAGTSAGKPEEAATSYDPAEVIVSPETTYLIGPLNADGTVNYYQYAHDVSSAGVTPENNAAIGILQVLDPDRVHSDEDAELLIAATAERLGVSVDTLRAGPKWVGLSRYCDDWEWETALPEDYAWVDWREIQKELASRPWSAEEYPLAAEWLVANAEAMDYVVATVSKSEYYWPDISLSDPPAPVTEPLLLGRLLGVAKDLSVRAMFRLDAGDVEGAWSDICAVRQMGRHMGDDTLLDHLVARGMEMVALDAQAVLLREGSPDAALLARMAADVAALEPVSIRQAIRGERLFSLELYQAAYAGHLPAEEKVLWIILMENWDGGPVNINRYMRRTNAWCDQTERIVDLPTYRAILTQWDAEFGDIQAAEYVIDMEEIAAKLERDDLPTLAWGSGPEAEAATDAVMDAGRPESLAMDRKMIVRAGEGEARVALAAVAVAMERYRLASGEYPADMAAMVAAGYLEAQPVDPFDGAPLRYMLTADEVVVYSVGVNGADDDGHDGRYGQWRECDGCDRDCGHDDLGVVLKR